MPGPFTPLAFANEFIARSAPHGVVHMKLQKLVYMCYGWWLVTHNDPIIGEQSEVWRHGPVFCSLYDTLKGHGHKPITKAQTKFFTREPDRVDDKVDKVDEVFRLIDWVSQRYGQYDQFYLSELTHRPGSPWYQTAAEYDFRVPRHTRIPVATIQQHFRKIAEDRGFSGAP